MRHARLPDAPDKTAGLTTSREQIIAALLDDRTGHVAAGRKFDANTTFGAVNMTATRPSGRRITV
jgi:hypothetical protein